MAKTLDKCIALNVKHTDWEHLRRLLKAEKKKFSSWCRSLILAEMDRMEEKQAERHASVS